MVRKSKVLLNTKQNPAFSFLGNLALDAIGVFDYFLYQKLHEALGANEARLLLTLAFQVM